LAPSGRLSLPPIALLKRPAREPRNRETRRGHLKRTLNPGITLVGRPRVNDSVEVTLAGAHRSCLLVEDEAIIRQLK
jgi:hypothetical protein